MHHGNPASFEQFIPRSRYLRLRPADGPCRQTMTQGFRRREPQFYFTKCIIFFTTGPVFERRSFAARLRQPAIASFFLDQALLFATLRSCLQMAPSLLKENT